MATSSSKLSSRCRSCFPFIIIISTGKFLFLSLFFVAVSLFVPPADAAAAVDATATNTRRFASSWCRPSSSSSSCRSLRQTASFVGVCPLSSVRGVVKGALEIRLPSFIPANHRKDPYRPGRRRRRRTTPTRRTGTSPKVIIMASSAAGKAAGRAVGKLHPDRTMMLLCDVQERFRPLAWKMETVINTCRYMTSVAAALDVPMLATQQYTKVFGPTVRDCFRDPPEDLSELLPIYEKKKFSMLTDEVIADLDRRADRDSYIVLGIEAHVCVQQTCLDLLERGADVHLVVDGVTSQQPIDREVALLRLQSAGCFLTTAQSAAFMLMRTADHPNFKAVSKLTVEHMKLPNEFNVIAGADK